MIRVLTTLLLLVACATATAEDEVQVDTTKVIKIAEMFGDCGGMFEYLAQTMTAIAKPDLAKAMHEQSNGALMAGAYLLYQATGKTKPLKDLMPFVQGRADVTMTRLRAAQESDSRDVLQKQQYICDKLGELQEELLTDARSETYLK